MHTRSCFSFRSALILTIALRLLLLVVVFFVLAEPTVARTIVVGGWNSALDAWPGIFETAYWLPDKHLLLYPLPLDTLEYWVIEWQLYESVKKEINNGEPVILLGYSHGATMVLRIAHQLSDEGISLKNVKLVTLDRVEAWYAPLLPPVSAVPPGTAGALNIYQSCKTPETSRNGGHVTGATEWDVTEMIQKERGEGQEVFGEGDRTAIQLFKQSNYHVYIQNSYVVRNRILKWLGGNSSGPYPW